MKRLDLQWVIDLLGEKAKYTMRDVNKVLNMQTINNDENYAISVVGQVAEHFGTTLSNPLMDRYLSPEVQCYGEEIAEPFQIELEPTQEVTSEPETIEPEVQPEVERQQKGTDFIQIHHYEVDKATGTVLFFVNTRCKKKRTKKFTGSLDNFDRKTKVYNNLDRSFSKYTEKQLKNVLDK